MTKPYLRDVRSDAESLLRQGGHWVVAGVEGSFPWPKLAQVVTFEGVDFILRPADDSLMPSIALNAGLYGCDVKEGQAKILRFATALTWSNGASLEVTNWISGSRPVGLGKWRGNVVCDFVTNEGLPQHVDADAWVSLALYREGLASKNVFYAFLSFFKVIASIFRDGKKRGAWIREKLPALDADDAIKRRDQLQADGIDVADYLFNEGRNAIAHAEKDIFVNPDEPVDFERIFNDTPIVRNLAEVAIEERYQVLRRRTRYQTKGIDVAGLKAAIGAELWQLLLNKSPVAEGQNVELPDSVAVVARRDASIHAYQDMSFVAVVPGDEVVRFVLSDSSRTVQFVLSLDLRKEALSFEPLQDMELVQEPESPEAIERAIKFLQFRFCIFCNGHVELWDEVTDSLIARTDSYLPLNMLVDHKAFEGQIARLRARKAELQG